MTYNRIRLLLMKDRGFMGDLHFLVAVAQLVRVLGCGPGGRGFESHQPPHAGAKIALLRFVFCLRQKTRPPPKVATRFFARHFLRPADKQKEASHVHAVLFMKFYNGLPTPFGKTPCLY